MVAPAKLEAGMTLSTIFRVVWGDKGRHCKSNERFFDISRFKSGSRRIRGGGKDRFGVLEPKHFWKINMCVSL